jgi:hypothetical protein
MFLKQAIFVLIWFLVLFTKPIFAQTDSTPATVKVFSGKSGFIKQKAIFLKIKADSAIVFAFDGRASFALMEFSDTIMLTHDMELFESANCNLMVDGSQFAVALKQNGKRVKLKKSLRVELNTFLNESWINVQRELFFQSAENNPKSYILYDKTIKDAGLLNLLEKDPAIFLNAYFVAFKDVKFEDDQSN